MSVREDALALIVRNQPSPQISDSLPWLGVVFKAVERKFGQHVQISNLDNVKAQLKIFVEDLQFEVVDTGTKKDPEVTQPCIVDISYKEFSSNQGEGDNKSTIRVDKTSEIATGFKYIFHAKSGVHFDHKYNFGAQIISSAMTGGFIRVGDYCNSNSIVSDQWYNTECKFQYSQREKEIMVPPDKKVLAKVTTSTKKFALEYTLQFYARNRDIIQVDLVSNCQKPWCCIWGNCCYCCFCCRPNVKFLSAADLLQEMPNFEIFAIEDVLPPVLKSSWMKNKAQPVQIVDILCLDTYPCCQHESSGTMCSFTMDGTLSWIGEECKVNKTQMDA